MADRVTIPSAQVESYSHWWDERHRTSAWANRYGGKFDQVRELLDDSRHEIAAERARARSRRRQFITIVGILAAINVLTGIAGIVFFRAANAAQAVAKRETVHAARLKTSADELNVRAHTEADRAAAATSAAKVAQHRADIEKGNAAAAQRLADAAKRNADAEAHRATMMAAANAQQAVTIRQSNAKLQAENVLATEATHRAVAARLEAVRGRGTLFLENGTAALHSGDAIDSEVLLAAAYRDNPNDPALAVLLPQAAAKVETRVSSATLGRGESVLAVASSTNAQHPWFATGDASGRTTLWSFDGRKLAQLPPRPDAITALGFDPSGTVLVAGARDGTTMMTHLPDGKPVALTGHRERVNGVAFSPDGSRVATSSADGTVRLWAVADGAPVHTFTLSVKPSSPGDFETAVGFDVAFSGDGAALVACEDPGRIQAWNLADFSARPLPGGLLSSCHHLVVSPKANLFAADDTMRPGTLAVFPPSDKTKGGAPVFMTSVVANRNAAINGIAFNRDGTRIVVASNDGTAQVVDTDLHPVRTFGNDTGSASDRTVAAGFTDKGASVVTVHGDGGVHMYNLETADEVTMRGHAAGAFFACAPGSDEFMTAGAEAASGNVVFWHLPRRHDVFNGTQGAAISAIAPGRGTDTFATGARNGTIVVWRYGSSLVPSPPLTLASDGTWVDALHFDATKSALVAAGGTHVRAWRLPATPITPDLHPAAANVVASDALILRSGDIAIAQREVVDDKTVAGPSVGWSMWSHSTGTTRLNPDKQWLRHPTRILTADGGRVLLLASKVNGIVHFIDARTMKGFYTWNDVSQIAAARSRDLVAVGGQLGGIGLVTASTGKSIATWRHRPGGAGVGRRRITALAFSDDTRWLASAGGDDGVVRLWDVDAVLRTKHGPKTDIVLSRATSAQILRVDFSPGDGRFVLTVTSDGDAEVWSRETGQLLETLRIPGTSVTVAAFIANGDAVAVGAADGRVAAYGLRPPPSAIRTTLARVLRDAEANQLEPQALVRAALADLRGTRL